MISLTVLIPAYNEAPVIGEVVRGCREALAGQVSDIEILVVDDGSTDGTGAAAESAGARVVAQPINRGYGRSILTGIEHAKHNWIGLIDAYGSYSPTPVPHLLPYPQKNHIIF